jgi:hypothetical protein
MWYIASVQSILTTAVCIGFEVHTAVLMKSPVFWNITPCSLLKVNRRFGGIYRLHRQVPRIKPSKKPAWNQVPGKASTLNTEATCSSETSVDFQRTTRRYIQDDRTLHEINTCYSGSIWREPNSSSSSFSWRDKLHSHLNPYKTHCRFNSLRVCSWCNKLIPIASLCLQWLTNGCKL